MQWGDQHRIAADKHAILNYRPVFVVAVIVASDSACADIDVSSDIGIPDVAEVTGFGSSAYSAVFDFAVVADVDVRFKMRSGSHVTERADDDRVFESRLFDHG